MAGNGYEKRWEIESELGRGGQGTVHRVIDKQRGLTKQTALHSLIKRLRQVTGPSLGDNFDEDVVSVGTALSEILKQANSHDHFAALKVLHRPEDARDAATADERIQLEISAMQTVKHPNLVEIFDADAAEQWYVSRFYSGGMLSKKLGRFKGDFPSALRAFRGLVDGVAALHKAKIVHRDIKPQNIFIADDGSLVLGDFGLVFFQDDTHTRISETIGNVGTRAWMPPWAFERRVEELRATFDVFSLGKVLWSMVSGRETLPFWYFNRAGRDDLNVERMFPNAPSMNLANDLLGKCIVEDEHVCLESAEALLVEVDRVLLQIERGGSLLRKGVIRHCGVCGIGNYELLMDRAAIAYTRTQQDPFRHTNGDQGFDIYRCGHCGHAQFFAYKDGQPAPAWQD